MIVRFAVLISLVVQTINCCSLITAELRTELKGEGFHRLVQTSLELSSLKRLIDCKVSYYFQIPKGAFLDTEGLNVSLLNHCFLATPFNTELPANHASLNEHKPIIFQSNIELRKVFVFSDELKFPLHLRYHEPSNHQSGLSNSITIQPPTIYLHCKNNETLMADESCRSSVEKLACTCKSRPKCEYLKLRYKKKPSVMMARVPVGKLWQASLVTYSTIFIVFGVLFWTIYTIIKHENTVINNDSSSEHKKTN